MREVGVGETRRDRNRERERETERERQRDRGSEREAGTESMTWFMSLERSVNGSDVLCTHVPLC